MRGHRREGKAEGFGGRSGSEGSLRVESSASTLRIVSVWTPITPFILPLLLHLRVVREPASFFLSKRNLLSRRLVHNSPGTGTTVSRETECQEGEPAEARNVE